MLKVGLDTIESHLTWPKFFVSPSLLYLYLIQQFYCLILEISFCFVSDFSSYLFLFSLLDPSMRELKIYCYFVLASYLISSIAFKIIKYFQDVTTVVSVTVL